MGKKQSLLRSAINTFREERLVSLLEEARDQVVQRERSLLLSVLKHRISGLTGNRLPLWPAGVTLERPVFVIGNPRSGTSLFVRCFGKHPTLAEWSEAGEVWDAEFYDAEQDHKLTEADLTTRDRERVRNTFLTYTALSGKERFVNKHPRNSLRIGFIREIFPDARFIHLVRHPIGAVDSMIRRSREAWRRDRPLGGFVRPPGWKDDVDEDAITKFSRCWKRVNEHVLRERDENCTTVKYEAFCESPLSVLRTQQQAVGLEPALSRGDLPENIENQNGKSVENFSQAEHDRLWGITGEVAERFGYVREPTWLR
jgi:hypothetical protein